MNNLALSDEILLKIEKPVRYIGNEVNMVRKDPEGKIRFAMCFPDVYEIGMSHLGMKIIYDQMNRRDDVYCERVFSPWVDLDKVMREENIPLFALESQDPVFMFDFLAVTIQYEMCYTNILQILDLSQIGIYAKDRREDAPFVIGGGILVALAFLTDTLMGYGATGGSAFGTCTPISAFFKYVGGLAMGLMVPVLSGYIAYSIADRPGLAVGFTGGLLAANGNALFTSYDWSNLGGFNEFVGRFAFQGENGGTTVSGFLGGILVGFLAGYVVLGLKKLCAKLPDSLEGIKPTLIYPLGGMLIVSILMCFIFNPIIGLINTGFSNMLTGLANAGMLTLLGCLLGAMMAVDMGGPINKAAYVFGTGMLATASDLMASGVQSTDMTVQACYIAMASIMVGGMVPPIGIALACQFFPKKFTEAERGSKISNLVMGCSFITEAAIPFAASDPAHVIPCTLVGAGVAGGLSAFFGCTLMAPHGGIFVFATIGKPLFYILSWVIGSIITTVMLGFIKKDAQEV